MKESAMTAAMMKILYDESIFKVEELKAQLKLERGKATEFSNSYGRLCREELREASKTANGQGEVKA